jgi:hypothetical protein
MPQFTYLHARGYGTAPGLAAHARALTVVRYVRTSNYICHGATYMQRGPTCDAACGAVQEQRIMFAWTYDRCNTYTRTGRYVRSCSCARTLLAIRFKILCAWCSSYMDNSTAVRTCGTKICSHGTTLMLRDACDTDDAAVHAIHTLWT